MAAKDDTTFAVEQIKEKFACGLYLVEDAPRILDINNEGVFVSKYAPHPDELRSLNVDFDWDIDSCLTPKLTARSYGEYELFVGVLNTKYFDCREDLDDLFSWGYEPKASANNLEKISLGEALKTLTVDISCNMQYYFDNLGELEADLGRKLENLDVNNEEMMKRLKAELFYVECVRIFGEDAEDDIDQETDQKSLTFKDFRILYLGGSFKLATARRGDFYVIFDYTTT